MYCRADAVSEVVDYGDIWLQRMRFTYLRHIANVVGSFLRAIALVVSRSHPSPCALGLRFTVSRR